MTLKPHRYLLLTEVPPMREGGHGCHVLATTLLDHLGDQICAVVTQRYSRRISPRRAAVWFSQPFFWHSGGSRVGLRRIFPEIAEIFAAFSACVHLLTWKRRILALGTERIFLLLGSSAWYLPVGVWSSRILHLPLDIYVVDDLEESARFQNRRFLQRIVGKLQSSCFSKADRIFAISPELAEQLRWFPRISAEWLPIPLPAISDSATKFLKISEEIVYVGGVNFLYAEALVEVWTAIEKWNQLRPDKPLTLHVISYSPEAPLSRLLDKIPGIRITRNATNSELRSVASRARALILPYSHLPNVRRMVKTSFPSKLGEYFRARRPILLYAPLDSSSARYFATQGLPLATSTQEGLISLLDELFVIDESDLLCRYLNTYQSLHSSAALRAALNATTFSALSQSSKTNSPVNR